MIKYKECKIIEMQDFESFLMSNERYKKLFLILNRLDFYGLSLQNFKQMTVIKYGIQI